MSKLPPCSHQTLFYIVPLNEAAIPVCRIHTGDVMENLVLRGANQNGWCYVPHQTINMGPCHGPDGGKAYHVAAPAPVAPPAAVQPPPEAKPQPRRKRA